MFDINMYDLFDLPNEVTYIIIGEPEWYLMEQIIIDSLTTTILPILFLLARWATIEMPSNTTPKISNRHVRMGGR